MGQTIRSVGSSTHQSRETQRKYRRIAMPHAYTEDQLIEQPAIGLFADMEWATANCL